jgi:hypothetical protein
MVDTINWWERIRQTHILLKQLKAVAVFERIDVFALTATYIVETKNLVTFGKESFTEVTAEKARTARD